MVTAVRPAVAGTVAYVAAGARLSALLLVPTPEQAVRATAHDRTAARALEGVANSCSDQCARRTDTGAVADDARYAAVDGAGAFAVADFAGVRAMRYTTHAAHASAPPVASKMCFDLRCWGVLYRHATPAAQTDRRSPRIM